MYSKAQLAVHYRPDRRYKETLVSLAPQVDMSWPLADGMPVDFLDTAAAPPVEFPPDWYDSGCCHPDLFLTPSMCWYPKMSALPQIARFRVPDADLWEQRLSEKVGPGWFTVVHYREPTYGLRPEEPERDFRVDDALPVYDAIIQAGGQVVRIGHKGMTPVFARPEVIDLSADDLLLQATAISRARFFMELSPSGPAQLALPFGCPLLRCNQTSIGHTFADQAVAMPRRVKTPAGEDVTRDVISQGKFSRDGLHQLGDLRWEPNAPEQLVEGAALMLKHTKAQGWRAVGDRKPLNSPGKVTLPLENRLDVTLLI